MTTRHIPATRVVGLSGKANSGKDTGARRLIELGFTPVAVMDPCREMLYRLNPIVATEPVGAGNESERLVRLVDLVDHLGWDVAKELPEVRRLHQVLAEEGGRQIIGRHVWIDAAFRHCDAPLVVVTDVRTPEEVEYLEAHGGVVIRIVRPTTGAPYGWAADPTLGCHVTETALDGWDFTRVIVNAGSEDKLGERVCWHVDDHYGPMEVAA
jgi:hypothetical protein